MYIYVQYILIHIPPHNTQTHTPWFSHICTMHLVSISHGSNNSFISQTLSFLIHFYFNNKAILNWQSVVESWYVIASLYIYITNISAECNQNQPVSLGMHYFLISPNCIVMWGRCIFCELPCYIMLCNSVWSKRISLAYRHATNESHTTFACIILYRFEGY